MISIKLRRMFLLVLFVAGCYATAVSDVRCNGNNAITFIFTKNANTAISKFTLTGCSGQNVDLPTTAYTNNGNEYSFDFNPYDQCVTSPARNPDDASTYSVDITLLAMRNEDIAGQTVIKGGDQAGLKCTFDTNYRVENDLGTLKLSGEEVTGEEFTFAFVMDRTQSDYATPDTTEVETNQLVYHTITATNPTQIANTDFTFKPYSIKLQKKSDPTTSFDLFNVAMSTCGHDALNFKMTYTNGQYNFEYSQILLDSDLSAEYKLVADLKLCNSDSSSPECTAFDKCTASTFQFNPVPAIPVARGYKMGEVQLYEEYYAELTMTLNSYDGRDHIYHNRNVLTVGDSTHSAWPEISFLKRSDSNMRVTSMCKALDNNGVLVNDAALTHFAFNWVAGTTKTIRIEVTNFEQTAYPDRELQELRVWIDGVEQKQWLITFSHLFDQVPGWNTKSIGAKCRDIDWSNPPKASAYASTVFNEDQVNVGFGIPADATIHNFEYGKLN